MSLFGGAWRAVRIGWLEGRRARVISRLLNIEARLCALGWTPPPGDSWFRRGGKP